MIFLGSLLTEPTIEDPTQADGQSPVANVRPDAPIVVAGFLILGGVIGLVGGLIGARLGPPPDGAWPWPARLVLATTAATLPLLLLGGLVTSTKSGMAVPDWPGSYGANMVLFPLGLMANPRIFLEHSHRLFGMLVGAATIAAAIGVWCARRPGNGSQGISGAALTGVTIAVPLVIIQGVLGGTRVTENSPVLAVMHGVLGQVFFTLLAVVTAAALPAWRARPEVSRRVRRLAMIVLGMLLLQLVFGAMFRHMGHRSWHPLVAHIALAFVILIAAPVLGARLSRREDPARSLPAPAPAVRKIGKGLMHATGLQFLLGWGALAGAWLGQERGPVPLHTQLKGAAPVPLWEVVLTTAHQANGAVLLVLAGLAVAWTWPRRRITGAPAGAAAAGAR